MPCCAKASGSEHAKAGAVCAPQTLYESSIAFGMRKALQTEAGKSDMEQRINTLEAEAKDLERQVELLQTL